MSFTIQPDVPHLFSAAIGHHRAGRLDAAADLYLRILAAVPDHADSLNLLGVIAHQKGNDQQAVDLIRRAITLKSDWPSYHVNLATAYRGIGRHEEAAQSCRQALALQSDLAEAHLALGLSLQALKQWDEAGRHLQWLADHRPADSRGPQALAGCLRDQGRTREAADLYHEAIRRNPDDAAAHLGLGTLLLTLKEPAAAEPHLARAAQLLPSVVAAWTNFGSCLIKLGRERDAIAILRRALDLSPNDLALGVNLGQAYLGAGETRAAENCFRAVLERDPNHAGALGGLADARRAADRVEEAVPLYERAQEFEPGGPAFRGLADALWESGDVERAAAVLREGIARYPDDADSQVRLATFLAAGGDLEGAAALCRTALRIRPGHAFALVELAQVLRAKLPPELRGELEAALQKPASAAQRAALHFGLAQVADASGDYAMAAEHARQANELKKSWNEARQQGYDPAEAERYIDRLMDVFQPEAFARFRGAGVPDERPVFVVGMPRSGTTLVEQILASHPQVFGAGERRFAHQSLARLAQEHGHADDPLKCLETVKPLELRGAAEWHLQQLHTLDGGEAACVVDKMPDNYFLLGWLALLFPKARFIHCRRDVRDVALSCWLTDFAHLRWANDLEHIAGRVRGYQRLMEHWRRVLPVLMLEVDYEELVADQEGVSRKMVKWLGLRWNKACLAFHRSERLVKTASVTQVRQPIYSRSVGRWRNYQAALAPILVALGRERGQNSGGAHQGAAE